MPRFDIYRNPNPRASHGFYLDVQSDLVATATRWCIPLALHKPGQPLIQRAQTLIEVQGAPHVMDTPNLLAVPAALLRHPLTRIGPAEQGVAEASIEFMLRGH